jgi:spore coat polysaccharide biosynthesis predicted glycosyltransferase SpsG
MGAYDSLGVSLNVIKAINNISVKEKLSLKTLIILAKGSPIIKKVKLLIKQYKNFELIIDPENMGNIYNFSDIAIGAPGLSHLERLYMGLPTILISQNNIHKLLVDNWVNLGCAIKSKNKINLIEKNIVDVINNKKIKNKLIDNGIQAVDGKGSLRIANSILKLTKSND